MNETEKDIIEASGYAYIKERDKFKDVSSFEIKTIARQQGKDYINLLLTLLKQDKDSLPIKYIGRQGNRIIMTEEALLKAQKEHKALEIIKRKCLTNCNIALVKDNLHYQNYCKEFEYFLNKYNESPNGFEITKEDLLAQEEFNLLKEVLE